MPWTLTVKAPKSPSPYRGELGGAVVSSPRTGRATEECRLCAASPSVEGASGCDMAGSSEDVQRAQLGLGTAASQANESLV